MQSLRHLRDPHYQGIRSRKARRVIDKSGDRNVTSTNIPERSWRFLKDFVNTLVRIFVLLCNTLCNYIIYYRSMNSGDML